MVQLIDRPHHELDVPLRIDIIEYTPCHGVQIAHVGIVIDNDYAFGAHSLWQGPDSIHYLSSLSRIVLANRDDHQIVEDTGKRHVIITYLWKLALHQWQEYSFDC